MAWRSFSWDMKLIQLPLSSQLLTALISVQDFSLQKWPSISYIFPCSALYRDMKYAIDFFFNYAYMRDSFGCSPVVSMACKLCSASLVLALRKAISMYKRTSMQQWDVQAARAGLWVRARAADP